LPVVLRDLFNKTLGVSKWRGKNVDPSPLIIIDVEQFNSDDFLVIGGGGLFLADTSPNDISGWQWAIESYKILLFTIISIIRINSRYKSSHAWLKD